MTQEEKLLSDGDCTSKVCRKCLTQQPLANFSRYKRTADGFHFRCKKCCSEDWKAYKEKGSRRWKAYKEANAEAISAQKRQYHAQNRDRLNLKSKVYREENPEKISAGQRRWREKNPERKKAQRAAYNARKHSASGSHTENDIRQMYEDQGGVCAYCEVELNGKYDIEHMQPLSKGGSNDWSNIALSCRGCNSAKNIKTLEEFIEEWRSG